MGNLIENSGSAECYEMAMKERLIVNRICIVEIEKLFQVGRMMRPNFISCLDFDKNKFIKMRRNKWTRMLRK